MPEVQVPEGTTVAPTYRLDVQLHDLLMKPPEHAALLPPPPNGKQQTLAHASVSAASQADGSAG